jgi:hypothetical protein
MCSANAVVPSCFLRGMPLNSDKQLENMPKQKIQTYWKHPNVISWKEGGTPVL